MNNNIHFENFKELLKSLGFIPIGFSGIWSNGIIKYQIDFIDNKIIIKLINE
mgnify:FL=1